MAANRLNTTAFILCCCVLLFTTLAYGGVHQPIIAIYYSLVIAAAAAWAFDGFRNGKLAISDESLQLPLIGATLYAYVQIIPFGSYNADSQLSDIPRTISLDPFATLVAAFQFTAVVIFFAVLLYTLNSAARIRKLFLLLVGFGFVFAFYAVLQAIISPDKIYGIYDVSYGAPFGSFVNRNNFAAYIEMTIALPLGLLFVGAVAKDKRLLFITAIVLLGAALLLSRSRGGFVAFFAEIVILFLLTRRSASGGGLLMRAASIVILITAIVAGAIFVGGDTSLSRFADTAASEDFSTQRSHIWAVTTEVIKSSMPFGVGFGAFAVAYTRFDNSSGLARVEQAHNDYLQVLADAGIPGALLGLIFLFLFLRRAKKINRIANTFRRGIVLGAFAGCFAVLVHSLFDFVLHVTAVSLLFVSLLALMSAGEKEYEDDADDGIKRMKGRRRVRKTDEKERPLLS